MTGISISGGADAGNYALVNNTATTTANITVLVDDDGCDCYSGGAIQRQGDLQGDDLTCLCRSGGSRDERDVQYRHAHDGYGDVGRGTGTDAGKLVATLSNVPLLDPSLSSPAATARCRRDRRR